MAPLSIRNHLLLLVVAVSCPLAVVVGYGIYHDLQQDIAHTKASLRTLARTMVNNTGYKLANAQHMLEQMAKRPLVRQMNSAHCDEILKDVLALNQGYANVSYADMQGVVVCSAVPLPGSVPVQLGQYVWFQESLKRQEFTVGAPFLGPISHKWVSVLSSPIWNDRHEMLGTVQLPLDLNAFDPKIPTQFLPEGSRFGFFNADGVMVWRNLDPERVIGTRPNADAARKIVAIRDGEFESLAIDGVVRYFSVVPMPQTGWVAFVGVPASTVYAAARQRALTSVIVALAVLVLLVLLAAAIARRIIRPISQLEQTARAIQAGALDARAVTGGPKEISKVAQAFNAMADQIQSSTRQMEDEIIKREQAEVMRRQSDDRYRRIVETAGEGIWTIDDESRTQFVNPKMAQMLGYSVEEMLGVPLENFMDSEGRLIAANNVKRRQQGISEQHDFKFQHKDGSALWTSMSTSPILDADGSYIGALAMVSDISQRKQAEEQVRQMAFYDTLTKLPNRRLLIDRLSQTIAANKRNACYGALMFLDLDNFKPLNDKYGHEVGDSLLSEVAQRLINSVREVDTVARFGGDEFVVILNELDADPAKSAAQASITADKILSNLSKPYSLLVTREGQVESTLEHHCTASMGVAMFIDHDVSPETILKWADMAMYEAKKGGRNRASFYDPVAIKP